MKNKLPIIARTIMQLFAYINQIIALIGMNTFAINTAYQWITLVLTVVVTMINYWYNNDWTKAAKLCSEALKMIKDGKITELELQGIIEIWKESSKSKENDSN